ncbi:uncharacterized protein Tco025E_02763 [Trypanosoma conorhini]|uniref:Uncharacterized protein n=1 Tax=Trypanosoma conorhini TaxID=83891 RepID=A0A3R7NUL0_9TRYP|nr:uncharacterized protein Tco025E_02763 [Trypanosoma conorhini]RNF23790.1 hypothetical protein Tco025E_02763 [Trypanosoma conorhini]
MPKEDLNELLNVPVPTHRIVSDRDRRTGKATALRSRMHPIPVTGYDDRPTEVARRSRRQQLRAEIIEELEGNKPHRRSHVTFFQVLFVLLVVGLAWAVSVYAPDFAPLRRLLGGWWHPSGNGG